MSQRRLTLILVLVLGHLLPGSLYSAGRTSFEMASMLTQASGYLDEQRARLAALVRALEGGADRRSVAELARKQYEEATEVHTLTLSFLVVANRKYPGHAALLASLRDRIETCYGEIEMLNRAATGRIARSRVKDVLAKTPPRAVSVRPAAIAATVGASVAKNSSRPRKPAASAQIPIPLPIAAPHTPMADAPVVLPAPIID